MDTSQVQSEHRLVTYNDQTDQSHQSHPSHPSRINPPHINYFSSDVETDVHGITSPYHGYPINATESPVNNVSDMFTNHVTRQPGGYFATPGSHNEIFSDSEQYREISKNLKLDINNSNSFGRGYDSDHFVRNTHSMNMNMNHHSIGFSQLSKIRARPASAVRLPTFNPHQFQPQKKPNQSPVSISTQHIPPSQQPQQAQQYQHQHQAQHRQQHQHGSMNQQHVQHQQQQQHQQQHAHPAIVRRNRQMSEVSGVSSMFDGTMGNSVAIGNYHMENMENLNNVNTHYNLVSNASNSNPFRNKGNNDYHNDIINKHRLSAQLGLEIHVQESDGDSNAISPVSPGTGDNGVTVGGNYNNDPNKTSLSEWDQVRVGHPLLLMIINNMEDHSTILI